MALFPLPSPRSPFSLLAAALLVLPATTVQAQEATVDRDEIVHVLNRITFGPRPGDVEAVQKIGLHNYIEQQLHPETIDDSAVEKQVAAFDVLQMSSGQLAQLFEGERKNQAAKTSARRPPGPSQRDRAQSSRSNYAAESRPSRPARPDDSATAHGRDDGPGQPASLRRRDYAVGTSQARPRDQFGVPAPGSARRFLGQSFQHRHEKGPRSRPESRR